MKRRRIRQRFGASADGLRQRGVALYKQGCSNGDPAACHGFGKLLVSGEHVPIDVATGTRHLESACAAGHAPACFFLANAYDRGTAGLKRDEKRAVELLESACKLGSASSCTILGDKIAGRDKARAQALYDKACEGDDGAGCARVGASARDKARALAAFLKACDLDHAASCADAGAMFAAGRGTNRDAARARELHRMACDGESGAGCASLAALLATGAGGKRHWGQAVELSERACELKYRPGCKQVARLRRNPPDWRCATEVDCDALCEEGIGRSCRKLGELRADKEAAELLRDGAGPRSEPSCHEAEAAYDRGCERGDGVSCLRIGKHEQACDAGIQEGCVKVAAEAFSGGEDAEKKAALRSLERMCSRRDGAAACAQLALLVSDSNPKKAARLLARTCKRGHAASCRLLGHHLGAEGAFPGGTTPCGDESLADCEQNIKAAQKEHARQEKAAQKGRDLIRRACELGDRQACMSPSRFFTPAVAKKLKARSVELLKLQSCGRGEVDE